MVVDVRIRTDAENALRSSNALEEYTELTLSGIMCPFLYPNVD